MNASYESGGHHFNFQLGEIEFLLELQPGEIPAGVPVPVAYEKRPSLIETLLETRSRCQRWLESGRTAFPGRPDGPEGPSYGKTVPLRQDGQSLTPAVARRLEGLWSRIRQDFPAADHPLLDYVLQDWFVADGWLTHGHDTSLEQALIARAATEADQAGDVLRQQLQELLQAARPADDPAWLQLCVKAAEFVPLVRRLGSLQAAIEHLGTEYPQQFAAQPLAAASHGSPAARTGRRRRVPIRISARWRRKSNRSNTTRWCAATRCWRAANCCSSNA